MLFNLKLSDTVVLCQHIGAYCNGECWKYCVNVTEGCCVWNIGTWDISYGHLSENKYPTAVSGKGGYTRISSPSATNFFYLPIVPISYKYLLPFGSLSLTLERQQGVSFGNETAILV